MAYLLDTNVLIEAQTRCYGMDFCPAFWEWMTAKHAEGQVFRDEIEAGNDTIADWVGKLDKGFFIEPSPEFESALTQVNDWAMEQNYKPVVISEFMNVAGCHLVAHALQAGHKVVTLEKRMDSKKKIKIPNACRAFGIKCITTFEMLRFERARFILDPPK